MPALRHELLLAIALATGGCAEIEFGVPAGGSQAGGAGGGPSTGGDSGGGGGSLPAGEQCLNGVDDDNDGLADCADSDCADVGCVEIPPGWLGPVELRDDDSECAGAFSLGIASLKSKVDAPPATCTCACNGNLETCDNAILSLFGDNTCTNLSSTSAFTSGSCEPLLNIQGVDSFQVSPSEAGGGCSSAVDTVLPPATFEARRLCGLSTEPAGCDGGTCAPSSTCVYMPGNVVCPNGFGTPFMGNAGVVDSRSCSQGGCFCGGATGGCTFVFESFNNSNCNGGTLTATTTNTCEQGNFGGGGGTKSALYTATAAPVSCPPTGVSLPMGDVSGSEPITVCCAQ